MNFRDVVSVTSFASILGFSRLAFYMFERPCIALGLGSSASMHALVYKSTSGVMCNYDVYIS